jgi:hypothetical protein
VVLVPLNPQKSFGDLYEIRSTPSEIFVNGATIDNIDVIDALTSTNLRTAPGSGVGGSVGSNRLGVAGSSSGGSGSNGGGGY